MLIQQQYSPTAVSTTCSKWMIVYVFFVSCWRTVSCGCASSRLQR